MNKYGPFSYPSNATGTTQKHTHPCYKHMHTYTNAVAVEDSAKIPCNSTRDIISKEGLCDVDRAVGGWGSA